MRQKLTSAGAGTLVLLVTLVPWRVAQPHWDGAALLLLPMAVAVFLGTFSVQSARQGAWAGLVFLPASPLAPWLRGRISAFAVTLVITLVSVPVMAAEVALAPLPQLALIAALVPVAGLAQGVLARRLLAHVIPAYAGALAVRLALVTVGGLFLVLHVGVDWFTAVVPGTMHLPFATAMERALAQVPGPGGWVTEALQLAQAGGAVRLWLLAHLDPAGPFGSLWPLAIIIHLVMGALVVLSVAQVAISVRIFCHHSLFGKREGP
jgi:hypothetical protein